MPAPAPRFSAETLRFLRGLKRNNRREWFNANRERYEAHVRQPMTTIVERLAENKAPYKTHIAAVFPTRGLPKHEGAGLYFHVSPDEVWMGGGMYAPQPQQLHAVREHIAANLKRLRAIVESPGFRRQVGALEGERLQRVPRGFAKDHPAAEFLRFRQF